MLQDDPVEMRYRKLERLKGKMSKFVRLPNLERNLTFSSSWSLEGAMLNLSPLLNGKERCGDGMEQ